MHEEKQQVEQKLVKVETEKKDLVKKVVAQDKILNSDPNAPSTRMLKAKLKQQGFSKTMRDEQEKELPESSNGPGLRTFSNFNTKGGLPDNLELCDDLEAMRNEIHKLRTESRGLAQRLKKETENRNRWEEVSRQKEQDMADQAKQLDEAK